jgi:hypothetical protein
MPLTLPKGAPGSHKGIQSAAPASSSRPDSGAATWVGELHLEPTTSRLGGAAELRGRTAIGKPEEQHSGRGRWCQSVSVGGFRRACLQALGERDLFLRELLLLRILFAADEALDLTAGRRQTLACEVHVWGNALKAASRQPRRLPSAGSLEFLAQCGLLVFRETSDEIGLLG